MCWMVNLVITMYNMNLQNISKEFLHQTICHFENSCKEGVNKLLTLDYTHSAVSFIDLEWVETCIDRLKINKAVGCNGIMSEHIVYGNTDLYVHLCLLFNSLIRHCFMRSVFCVGLIVLLLKKKTWWCFIVEHVQGKTLLSVVSKLFEYVLLELFNDSLYSDNLQYGFKKGSGCVTDF